MPTARTMPCPWLNEGPSRAHPPAAPSPLWQARLMSAAGAGGEGASEAGEVWPPPCDDDSAKVWLVGSSRVEAAVQAAIR